MKHPKMTLFAITALKIFCSHNSLSMPCSFFFIINLWNGYILVKSVPNSNAKNAMITKMVSEIESKMLDLDREGRLQGLSNKKAQRDFAV